MVFSSLSPLPLTFPNMALTKYVVLHTKGRNSEVCEVLAIKCHASHMWFYCSKFSSNRWKGLQNEGTTWVKLEC